MQAVILAAGMGTRLKDLTKTVPKCMIEVHGMTVVERMLRQLDKLELSRVVFVVGFEGKLLAEFVRGLGTSAPIEIVDNPIYATTNNIYSLWLARDYLASEDTLLIESDLILEDGILAGLVNDSRQTLALVDQYESWMDGTVVTLSSEDEITSFVSGKEMPFSDVSNFFKTVNIYKLSQQFSAEVYLPALEAHRAACGDGVYYETALGKIALEGTSDLRARRLSGELWYEVDDLQDLDIAETLFAPDARQRLNLVRAREGGFWRYPKLVDAAQEGLVGFPTQRMLDELAANLPQLVSMAPSGPAVGSVLAGKLFGVHAKYALMCNSREGVLQALETHNAGLVRFEPNGQLGSYGVEDIVSFAKELAAAAVLVESPNRVTGKALTFEELQDLCVWSMQSGVGLVIDESLSEFAPLPSLLEDDFLAAHPTVTLVHSLSASYGLMGAPLTVVATSNQDTYHSIRNHHALCAIGSVDEYLLQIVEKYKGDRKAALERTIALRDELIQSLRQQGIAVFDSQADAVTVELSDVATYEKRAEEALVTRNILMPAPYVVGGRAVVRFGVASELDGTTLAELLETC